ncbi:restriction endonuclease subunit S [Janibacter terrae]|uniref:restriction endonuclease subunit S n=1 Tax=Janibacter terrae TaxID=103817 RepID=UPI0031FA01AF
MARATKTGGRDATQGVILGRFAISVGKPDGVTPEGFSWVPLSDVARLESGHTPSRRVEEYWDGGVPWIGIRDATGNHGRTIYDTEQHVTQAGLDNSSARLLPAGTVCLSRTASVGYVVSMGVPMATSQDFVNWVCGSELNSKYLHYALVLEQESIRRFSHGSTHQTMYYPEAKALHLLAPGRAKQDAIVEVLEALDDKIAANTRLVTTLGQLADAYFVDAGVQSSVSDLTFADVADVGGGGTPKTKIAEYWGGEINWATPTDVTALHGPYLTSTSRRITQAGLDNCPSVLYPTGSILMTSRATIGAFAVAQKPMAVNQGFIVVNSKGDVPQWWLFHEMRRRVPEFVSHANGATFLELSRGKFKNFHIHLASSDIMQNFADTADALHRRAEAAERESASLADTRDALLPLLMSGRVTVNDAESVVEGVA